jgi:hypothetical protein
MTPADRIKFNCPECGHRLKAPADLAGRLVKCPKCLRPVVVGAAEIVQSSAAQSQNIPIALETSHELSEVAEKCVSGAQPPHADVWYVNAADGQRYGPIGRGALDQWVAEGRINAQSRLLKAGASQSQWASEFYPQLAAVEPTQPPVSIAVAPPPVQFLGPLPLITNAR